MIHRQARLYRTERGFFLLIAVVEFAMGLRDESEDCHSERLILAVRIFGNPGVRASLKGLSTPETRHSPESGLLSRFLRGGQGRLVVRGRAAIRSPDNQSPGGP